MRHRRRSRCVSAAGRFGGIRRAGGPEPGVAPGRKEQGPKDGRHAPEREIAALHRHGAEFNAAILRTLRHDRDGPVGPRPVRRSPARRQPEPDAMLGRFVAVGRLFPGRVEIDLEPGIAPDG